jgi:PST family polysaccharide transporter
MGIGLVVGIWIARYLGPEQFGLLNYAVALVGLFSAVAGLGLDNIVVRDLVRDPSRSGLTMGTAFLLRLVSGGVAYGLVLVLITVLKPGDLTTQVVVGLTGATLVLGAFNVVEFWFQAHVRSKYTVMARNMPFLLLSVVRIGLIVMAAPLVAFAAAIALEALLGAIGLVIVYRATGQYIRRWRAGWARARQLIRVSWPLILTGLAIGVYMRIDQVMLGGMVGDEAVGLYSAAVRISEIWYFIPIAVVNSVMPVLIHTRTRNPVQYQRRVQKLLIAMAALGYAVAIPITFLGGSVISLLYGDQYAGAGSTLVVHIWAGLFVCLGVVQSAWLINEGLTRFSLMTTAVGAVLNVGLNFLLLPRYASLGAAIATLIAYGASVMVCLFYKPTRSLGQMTLKALVFRR